MENINSNIIRIFFTNSFTIEYTWVNSGLFVYDVYHVQKQDLYEEELSMDANVHFNDPREHVNEEPRDDLGDLLAGFGGMFLFMAVLFFAMVIIKFIVSG